MAKKSEYDVVGALQRVEEDLIKSMSVNMKKHISDEIDEDINWTQWQAEMLNGFAEYKAKNPKRVKGYFSTINSQIEEVIRQANQTGQSQTEIEILRAIQEGYKPRNQSDHLDKHFFKINARKLNTLIASTQKDFDDARKAVLRTVNDRYRKTIFDAQMYYNSGAGTIDKAIDMATKDFLSAGINCIQYSNGARVNIASYAEMALRTANTRANLIGSASMRDAYGEHLVLITSHNSACPRCIEWQGRVYVDNVYGSGDKNESRLSGYPLLSVAIDGGMFHPNCKNGTATFYEGITKEPKPTTKKQQAEMTRRYNLEQKQRYCERNIRKYKRLEAGSLDQENIDFYSNKHKEWKQRYNQLIDDNSDVLREDPRRLKLYGINEPIAKGTKANNIV